MIGKFAKSARVLKENLLKRLRCSFLFSLAGLKRVWNDEPAFRLEIIIVAVLTPVALISDVTAAERGLLLLTLFLPPVVELINSAVEAVVDLLSPEKHDLAKKAKDAASAAVMVSIAVALAVWLMVLLS